MVTGANRDGFHLKNVVPGRDFEPKWADLRTVVKGEGCPRCRSPLDVFKALEVGHIFKLGTRYSESMRATILDEKGQSVPVVMGSYGIGVERVAAAAIELHHDDDGMRWPISIAPYSAIVLALQTKDRDVVAASERLHDELQAAGIDVLFDDRDERPGVKFKDADLVGIPIRFAVGKKALAEGKVELKLRGQKEMVLVPLAEATARARQAAGELTPRASE